MMRKYIPEKQIQLWSPLIYSESDKVKQIMHRSIMKIGRYVKNSYCFKKSTRYILKSCGWHDIETELTRSSTKFIHKIIHSEKPAKIFKTYRCNRARNCKNITLNYFPKTAKFQRTIINKGHEIYNNIDPQIRNLNPKEFKKKVDDNCYLKIT